MKMFSVTRFIYALCLSLVCLAIFFQGESIFPVRNQKPKFKSSGKELAVRFCQMCHTFPEPGLLDRNTWEKSVLPNMGMRLGIRTNGADPFEDLDPIDESIVRNLNIYPDAPLILKEDWDRIVDYYVQNAPIKLESQHLTVGRTKEKAPFKSQFITIGDNKLPKVSLLNFNEASSELYIGDNNNLYALKNTGEISNSWLLNSPASHIEFNENSDPLLLTIGQFRPSDQELGRLANLEIRENNQSATIAISKLRRPVHFASADLNGDNKKDVVVCSFGNYGGKLSWFDNFEPSKEHVLSNLPGARMVAIKDLNGDQKPDIVVLMAQAYEQISIYYNKGQGEFEEKKVLEFSPVHGVSYFELADFNNDGFQDILLTNGDNWDYSNVDKPYQGLRIYLNDGHNNFKETFFYPMYGCSKAVARDFDNDGDLDIVGVSFYADLKDPRESFVYLLNNGDMKYTASFHPDALYGKWLTMEVADFNGDRRPDVMLGSFMFNFNEMAKVVASTGISSFPQVLLLTQIE